MLENFLPLLFVVIVVIGCVFYMFKRPSSEKGEKKSKSKDNSNKDNTQ